MTQFHQLDHRSIERLQVTVPPEEMLVPKAQRARLILHIAVCDVDQAAQNVSNFIILQLGAALAIEIQEVSTGVGQYDTHVLHVVVTQSKKPHHTKEQLGNLRHEAGQRRELQEA